MTKTRPSRQLDKLALFHDLGYEPHEGQIEIHLSRAPRRIVVCGVRWGKTLCAAYEAIAAALQPADESLGWIVAPSYELCDRVFVVVRRVVEQHLSHRVVPIRNARRRILLRNMAGGLSEIRGRSADTAESLLGEGLDWLIVDEAARLNAAIWEEFLSQRLVDRQGWALITSTPRGPGWFQDLYLLGGFDPLFDSWNMPSWSNPHLNPDHIEQERQRTPTEVFAQEYGAEFLDSAGNRICETCSFPEIQTGLVLLRGDEELTRCPECQKPIDVQRQVLGYVTSAGNIDLGVLRLHDWPEVAEEDGVLNDAMASP